MGPFAVQLDQPDAEHSAAVNMGLGNAGHIPRVLRLAKAIAASLESSGLNESEAEVVYGKLRSYARDLFLAEWCAGIYEGEDIENVMLKGEATFDGLSAKWENSQHNQVGLG